MKYEVLYVRQLATGRTSVQAPLKGHFAGFWSEVVRSNIIASSVQVLQGSTGTRKSTGTCTS
jgi:hypothetical protein